MPDDCAFVASMSHRIHVPMFVLAVVVTIHTAGCGDDSVVVDSAPGGSGGVGAGGASSSGTGAGGMGGDSPFNSCVTANDLIDLNCEGVPLGHASWVGAGAGACLGSQGNGHIGRVLFSLDEVDGDGNPVILGLRIEPLEGNAPLSGSRIEMTAPTPPLVSDEMPLSAALSWPGELEPMALAGGLSFVLMEANGGDITFDRALTLSELVDDTEVTGTFQLVGGTFTVLDSAGDLETVQDPEGRVMGCFRLPIELHPIELDR